MNQLTYKLIAVYILLLLALSALGVQNRVLLNRQIDRFTKQTELLNKITEARRAADSVQGPEAVRAWALAHNMEPSAPDNTAFSATFLAAPEINLNPNQTQLEILIKWR